MKVLLKYPEYRILQIGPRKRDPVDPNWFQLEHPNCVFGMIYKRLFDPLSIWWLLLIPFTFMVFNFLVQVVIQTHLSSLTDSYNGNTPNQQIPVTSNIHHDCRLHNQQLNGQFNQSDWSSVNRVDHGTITWREHANYACSYSVWIEHSELEFRNLRYQVNL